MISVRRHKLNRRAVVAGCFAVILLLCGGYALWSNAAWAGYHTSYSQWKVETKNKIDSALDLPATTAVERTKKLQALKTTSEFIASGDRSHCSISGTVSWQESINATYKGWRQECIAVRTAADTLNSSLTSASNYLQSEHELASVLATALGATNKKVTESTFTSVLSKWKAASVGVKSLKASTEFTPVKTKAQKAVDDIESLWERLVAAHAAKDETKYEQALAGLTGAYSAIDDIEKESIKQFTQLSKVVESRYEAVAQK